MTTVDPQADASQETRTIDEIEHDLESTREQLGQTVAAVTHKLDVKSRSRAWAQRTGRTAQARGRAVVDQHGRELAVAIGAVVALTIAAEVWRRRR